MNRILLTIAFAALVVIPSLPAAATGGVSFLGLPVARDAVAFR
jgi:hypothetical protein